MYTINVEWNGGYTVVKLPFVPRIGEHIVLDDIDSTKRKITDVI